MKISYRTHPILERIYKGSLVTENGILRLDSDSQFIDEIEGALFCIEWGFLCPEFVKETNSISESFLNAFFAESPKIVKMINTYNATGAYDAKDPRNVVNGTFLINKVAYTVHLNQRNQNVSYDFYAFDKDGIPLFFQKMTNNKIEKEWYSNSIASPVPVRLIIDTVWALAVFKKFADVETIVVEPHSRKKSNGVKQVNDTKLKICFLDSRWYTNIVRTDGFSVRGHLRLQPCGKGRSQIKPCWINEFKKSGYTLHARKQVA